MDAWARARMERRLGTVVTCVAFRKISVGKRGLGIRYADCDVRGFDATCL